jgi:hypothetical protein
MLIFPSHGRLFRLFRFAATLLLQRSLASPFCDLGGTAPLAMMDPVMLCVFVSTTPPKKMIFRMLVEEYASLVLVGSKTLALEQMGTNSTQKKNGTGDVHAWIATSMQGPAVPLRCNDETDSKERGRYVSCPQIYATADHIATALSLVVNVHEGIISSFTWDNSCEACGPQRCMKSAESLGACGRNHVRCTDSKGSCDLTVLVTWAGTDKDGRHMQSAGRRVSRFSGATINSMYETMGAYADTV